MRRLGDSEPHLRIITIQHIDVPFSTHRSSISRFCPMHGPSSISHRKALCLTMNAGGESCYMNYRTASMSIVLTKNTGRPVLSLLAFCLTLSLGAGRND